MKNNIKPLLLICVFFSLYGCQNNTKTPFLSDTPTKGTIHVLADECYKPILDSEKMVFEATYPEAKIDIIYKPSLEVMDNFDNDSIRLLITAMPYDSVFLKTYYKNHDYYPSVTILAKDAVAIIANNARSGLKVSQEEFKDICNGSIANFSQLKHGKSSGDISMVFDNDKSSTLQFIQDSILKGEKLTKNAFAQNTNTEVLNYVKTNKNALGIIGVNWISDSKDEETIEFSKFIFPVKVSDNAQNLYYYSPHPSYIAMHKYPYRRYMYATLKEGGAALGRGFVNFMSGDIGQKIVLKSGLAPATIVTRVVELKKDM